MRSMPIVCNVNYLFVTGFAVVNTDGKVVVGGGGGVAVTMWKIYNMHIGAEAYFYFDGEGYIPAYAKKGPGRPNPKKFPPNNWYRISRDINKDGLEKIVPESEMQGFITRHKGREMSYAGIGSTDISETAGRAIDALYNEPAA